MNEKFVLETLPLNGKIPKIGGVKLVTWKFEVFDEQGAEALDLKIRELFNRSFLTNEIIFALSRVKIVKNTGFSILKSLNALCNKNYCLVKLLISSPEFRNLLISVKEIKYEIIGSGQTAK